jgi:hypothetical protein
MPNNFEDEYFLLYPSDIDTYPLIYEDCHRLTCSRKKYKDCKQVPDCSAYFKKRIKIENPRPIVLDFFTAFTKKKVIFADCYMALSLTNSSFVVSPKLYSVLHSLNIEGIQLIPATLLEDNETKYTDFWYAHTYNFLRVLSPQKCRYQVFHGIENRNNLLEIKFNTTKLKKINLENRLIFRFPLIRSYFIFHYSVVEKIIAVNPVGFQFIQLNDYNLPNTNGIFL